MGKESELSFEKAMEQLEQIVSELESGDLSLADSLKRYEAGVKLTRFCSSKLENAEEKIEIIKEKAGEIQLENYEIEKGVE